MFKKFVVCLSALVSIAAGALAQTPLEARLRRHLFALTDDSLRGRMAGSPENNKVQEYLVGLFGEIGLSEPVFGESYRQGFDVKTRAFQGRCCNIVGVIRGNDPVLRNEYIVFGSHFDGQGTEKDGDGNEVVRPGAYDNASGAATLVEAARILAGKGEGFKRSIIVVAFDAEERGLDGSFFFVRYPPVPLERIKLVANIDQIGLFRKLGYVGIATLEGSRALIESLPQQGQLAIGYRELNDHPRSLTDDYPFALAKVPTLFMSSGAAPDEIYHKPGDRPENIMIPAVANATRHIASVIGALADAPELVPTGTYTPHKNRGLEVKMTNDVYKPLK